MKAETSTTRTATQVPTFSGRLFDLANPRAEDVDFADVAHALAGLPRFVNHTRLPISVAQHSVNCAKWAGGGYRPEVRLALLLHDGSEAYTNDIPAPVKAACAEIGAFCHRVQNVVYEGLGGQPLTEAEWRFVKQVDLTMAWLEAQILLPGGTNDWGIPPKHVPTAPKIARHVRANIAAPWDASKAEGQFRVAHRFLRAEMNAKAEG